MKILCLYHNKCALELFKWLESEGHEIVLWTERLDADWCRRAGFDLTVSYTYRYLIPETVLNALGNNVVNLHNSVLPWNRGADPNIWSYLDETPRGVTLHYMDAQLDKGHIIAQKLVNDGAGQTLQSSYDNLDRAAKELFRDAFRYYGYWQSMRKAALGKGSYHSVRDGEKFRPLIDSYHMPVELLLQKYGESANAISPTPPPCKAITPYNLTLFLPLGTLTEQKGVRA